MHTKLRNKEIQHINTITEVKIDPKNLIVLKDSPFFEDESKRRIWEKIHNKSLIKNLDRFQEELEMFTSLMEFKEGMRILDVGCGIGTVLLEFANIGAVCIGTDFDKNSCEILEISSRYFGLRTSAVHGDGCLLPFKNESFDAVISKAFFEHVKDVDAAIEEQIRVLKSGGKLVIKVGNLLDPLFLFDTLFIYPIETKGRHGGFKWIFTKSKAYECYGPAIQKDEDNKTLWWWRKYLRQYNDLNMLKVTTKGIYKKQYRYKILSKLFEPFLGSILVIAKKEDSKKSSER